MSNLLKAIILSLCIVTLIQAGERPKSGQEKKIILDRPIIKMAAVKNIPGKPAEMLLYDEKGDFYYIPHKKEQKTKKVLKAKSNAEEDN